MAIIRQPFPMFAVPDFRNLSVVLRVLVSVSLFLLILPLIDANNERTYSRQLIYLATWMAPVLIFTLLVLMLCCRWLLVTPYGTIYTWLLCVLSYVFAAWLFHLPVVSHVTNVVLLSLYIWILMHYQALIQKALSPALSEAKLAALTARIRPHFLFNSLNAAIALVRNRPSDAEMVLENLAELFRAQLQDGNQSSTLGREIELAQDYLAIETIRMGSERLQCTWLIEAPAHAEVPHLLLQPLLENAVYHGIEPNHRPSEINVSIIKRQEWIYIRIDSPLLEANLSTTKREGNHMAMQNLSERLHLMYDADAVLRSGKQATVFRVDMRLPYRRALKR